MNVVLIVANGLNCHWLGPYGNEWVSTPNFDKLATESVAFDRHFASAQGSSILNTCCGSIANQLVSMGKNAVFVDDRRIPQPSALPWKNFVQTRPAEFPTPGDALQDAMKTALQQSAEFYHVETDRLIPPWDFEFETYQQYAESSGGFVQDRNAEEDEPIDHPTPGPFEAKNHALWHRLHNSFAAAVSSFDEEIGRIVAQLRERGLDQSAAWIFTSNFGWPLGEHGMIGPDDSRMHEELVHLPLIVRLPGQREAMRRSSAFTQTEDVNDLIRELLGLAPAGQSVASLLSGGSKSVRLVCPIGNSVRTDDWAFLQATETQPARLYRKPDDIWEANDLAARHPDECDLLAAMIPAEPGADDGVR